MTEATARDMLDMLRRHYLPEGKPPGGIFAPEIQSHDGTRRADLIWLGVTAGSGRRLVGHEIKVTRSDVLAELADPAKSDPWQRFCHEWWLVVADPALVDGLELPPTWGVMAPPSGRRTRSMTIVRRAPRLKPYPQAPAIQTLATRLHWQNHEAQAQLRMANEAVERERAHASQLASQVPYEGATKSREREFVEQVLGLLGGVWNVDVKPSDVAEALRDLGAIEERVQRTTRSLRLTQQQLRGMHTSIGRVLAEGARA